MKQKDLHDVIVDVLKSSKTPLTARQIADTISEKKLWYRPKDGKFPPATQVSARVDNYKHLFIRNGIITLRNEQICEERIARLAFNKNGWTFPSGPEGKSKAKTSYETKYGYGHEEWLLDFSKTIGGYHYGFLQPINANHTKYKGSIFNVYLYTVNSTSKERFWVGKITNLEVIDEATSYEIKSIYKQRGWYQEMLEELKDLNLDEKSLDKWEGIHLFNVRFKPEDFEKYPEGTIIPKEDLTITSYHYVLLYVYDDPNIVKEADGKFILGQCAPGRRLSKKSITKKIEEMVIEYPIIHHKISRALEKTLKDTYDKVYAEHSTGFKTCIDLVAIRGNKKTFFEIKTCNDPKTCIRQAIGQLLEYSYYPDDKIANDLFIVTPYRLKDDLFISYIKNLRTRLNLPIQYMWYDLKNKKIGQIV